MTNCDLIQCKDKQCKVVNESGEEHRHQNTKRVLCNVQLKTEDKKDESRKCAKYFHLILSQMKMMRQYPPAIQQKALGNHLFLGIIANA